MLTLLLYKECHPQVSFLRFQGHDPENQQTSKANFRCSCHFVIFFGGF